MESKKMLNIEVGNRIRIARERAGLTQERLAEEIDRSTQFISTIERGIAGPSLETIISICDVLRVSSDWLLRGIEVTSDASVIVAKFSGMSAAQLLAVSRLADDVLTLVQISTAEKQRPGIT